MAGDTFDPAAVGIPAGEGDPMTNVSDSSRSREAGAAVAGGAERSGNA